VRPPNEAPAGALDTPALRQGRLARLKQELVRHDLAACVLTDPVNIRYATGARNMQVFHSRNPARTLVVPAEGPVTLFEFPGCHHLAADLETIDEIRPAITVSYAAAGPRVDEVAVAWAAAVDRVLRADAGGERRIGIERVNHAAAAALAGLGWRLSDAQAPVERARAIKSDEEIACIWASLAATERAVAHMQDGLRPGLTENQLWARLHQAVIEADGDYIETRLLSAGARTNPWFREAMAHPIRAGDLVALDTDVVGPYGYYADFSRTFFAGAGRRPSAIQRSLYGHAVDQVRTNIERIRPGMTFREVAERAWRIPERFLANRYFVLAHGVGMTGEYPYLCHAVDFDACGYDGLIEPGMTLCVESYIGEQGGGEGVKLEEQILITATGSEPLSTYPLDPLLLGREV